MKITRRVLPPIRPRVVTPLTQALPRLTSKQVSMAAATVNRSQAFPYPGAYDAPIGIRTNPAGPIDATRDLAFLKSDLHAPFESIGRLFDHLRANPAHADALNATYPTRGVFKTAAVNNGSSDQKLTIDLSPKRLSCIPSDLKLSLAPYGLGQVLQFFDELTTKHLDQVLTSLGAAVGVDLFPIHKTRNINFRLCDYTPDTAAPESRNGCGAHRDYGTFSIIFQDGTAGLEIESATQPGLWVPVPATQVVVLCGWSAFIVSGGQLRAVRHRVQRQPGVRRLSAVLFVAPDLDVALKPINAMDHRVKFSPAILDGEIDVRWFKEFMGKRWRWREGNAQLEDGEYITQDQDIERLILG
ncbi:oxidoreductase [Biscogniauxia mediterranea]|nr:oxidoreductase [Biscogniauxia mediterranea]